MKAVAEWDPRTRRVVAQVISSYPGDDDHDLPAIGGDGEVPAELEPGVGDAVNRCRTMALSIEE